MMFFRAGPVVRVVGYATDGDPAILIVSQVRRQIGGAQIHTTSMCHASAQLKVQQATQFLPVAVGSEQSYDLRLLCNNGCGRLAAVALSITAHPRTWSLHQLIL